MTIPETSQLMGSSAGATSLSGHVILQVIPELAAGGAERTTIEVAQAITQAGGRALVASAGGRLEEELADVGGELIKRPQMGGKSPLTLRSNTEWLAELVKTHKISLLHARSRAPAWSTLWAARRTGTAFVTTYHGAYNGMSAPKRLYNSVMARGDVVIANSQYIANHVAKIYPWAADRLVTIPRGVDLSTYKPDLVSSDRLTALSQDWFSTPQRPSGPIIFLPGRLTEWKGQIDAIAAMAKLSRSDAILIMAGDHQGRQSYVDGLEKQIAQLKLDGRALIVSHCRDMPAAYALCDLVIAPSSKPEAFGRVAAEAGAMGKPVIAARHGGQMEIVDDPATGRLVTPGNSTALAQAIDEILLLDGAKLAGLGKNAITRVCERFSTAALQACNIEGVWGIAPRSGGLNLLSVLTKGLSRTFTPPENPGDSLSKILVIKLGALGDFMQCLGAAKIVRETHPSAQITLLTTPPFEEFAKACPFFNHVETDGREKEIKKQTAMIRRIRNAGYDMVYDFQNNGRTERYFKAMGIPLWSGAAKGCSHPHANPNRAAMHNFDRLGEQLYHAGIGPNGIVDPQPWPEGAGPMPDVSWIKNAFRNPPHLEPEYFCIDRPYALIIPGSSPEHPEKRWPPEHFAEICKRLMDKNVTPVLIGGKAEGEVGREIARLADGTKNLMTRTDLFQLATLAQSALFTIGGDTGPMHLAAATDQPGLCLFAQEWNQKMERKYESIWSPETRLGRAAPKNPSGRIIVLHANQLEELSVDDVWRGIAMLGVMGR